MSIVVRGRIIEKDGPCWILARGRRKRKGGSRYSLVEPSYHASLEQVAHALVDLECGEALKVVTSLEELVHRVSQHLERAFKEERS